MKEMLSSHRSERPVSCHPYRGTMEARRVS